MSFLRKLQPVSLVQNSPDALRVKVQICTIRCFGDPRAKCARSHPVDTKLLTENTEGRRRDWQLSPASALVASWQALLIVRWSSGVLRRSALLHRRVLAQC